MGKTEKTPITINDKQYMFEDLTQEQQVIVNHLADLDRKLGGMRFNLDQLQIGRNAFMSMLEASIAKSEAEAEQPVAADGQPA